MVQLTRKKKILLAAGSAAVVLAIVLGVTLGTRNKGGDSSATAPISAGNPQEISYGAAEDNTSGA